MHYEPFLLWGNDFVVFVCNGFVNLGYEGVCFQSAAVARPSIDRPPREPVKLHKAEHAWKPDIGKKEV